MQKHRILLIGHGNISTSYVQAFSEMKHADIVGVVGRNLEKVKLYAEEHDIPFYGISMKQVAVQAGATAVVICTPNALHYEGVMEASELGLHCLCEKPLHISATKQDEMIESCKRNGVKLGVSYMRRFISHLQAIKAMMDAGKLGRILVVDVTIKHFRAKEYYDSWHGTLDKDGGGPFIQQGSHIIDLALWLNSGYKEIFDARMFQVYHDIETEDHGYAIVQYGNGGIGMIEASTASPGSKNEMIEISGTKGSISANYDEILTFEVPDVEKPNFDPKESSNPKLFERLTVDFIHAIEENRAPFISGESAKTATEFVESIYEKAGKPLRMFN